MTQEVKGRKVFYIETIPKEYYKSTNELELWLWEAMDQIRSCCCIVLLHWTIAVVFYYCIFTRSMLIMHISLGTPNRRHTLVRHVLILWHAYVNLYTLLFYPVWLMGWGDVLTCANRTWMNEWWRTTWITGRGFAHLFASNLFWHDRPSIHPSTSLNHHHVYAQLPMYVHPRAK